MFRNQPVNLLNMTSFGGYLKKLFTNEYDKINFVQLDNNI